MKASYIVEYGASDVIRYGDMPDPVMKKDQVFVEVKAASVNPVDYKLIAGIARMLTGFKFPKIIGSDYSGIVRHTGSEVSGIKPGDRVYGSSPSILRKPGVLAELIAINPKYARLIPEQMTFEEAASFPIAGLTALNGLRKCKVGQGSSVLINGATGGVGHFAVQIAKAKGAFVTATCSAGNADFARSLGADEVTGYSKEELSAVNRKYDAILDAYGKMNYADVCRLLKKRGIYASTLFFGTIVISSLLVKIFFNKKLTSANLRGRPGDFEEIEKMFTEKKLKPFIVKSFTLDNAAGAFEYAEKGRPRGKVIITV